MYIYIYIYTRIQAYLFSVNHCRRVCPESQIKRCISTYRAGYLRTPNDLGHSMYTTVIVVYIEWFGTSKLFIMTTFC